MEKDLYHRGPDSGGIESEPGFSLVFRRLSIMDPTETSDQPMTDPTSRYVLVFNGEIYNHRYLRDQLIAKGVTFRSRGDTEVLLNGYIHWGDAVLEKLEGMYSFVIVDRLRQCALAARDPYGIKPLYLLQENGLVAMASEMRPLFRLHEPEPDPVALAELMTFGWAAGKLSNIRGVVRVPGGTVLKICLRTGSLIERRFCDPIEMISPDESRSAPGALEEVHDAIVTSVRDHLQSDVGYALQLSGGVDSSLITAIATQETGHRLATFAVNLGNSVYDESVFRKQVTARYDVSHHEVSLDGVAYADALPRACRHMEGPVPHGGCVMLMLLCKEIGKSTKVVLTGEGADEFFGGYARYASAQSVGRKAMIGRLLPPSLWPNLWPCKGVKRYAGVDAASYLTVYSNFRALHALFPDLVPSSGDRQATSARFSDFRDRITAVDQSSYLESLLVRQDKMAMSASVEARVPFTHLPLARIVNRLPRRLRVPGEITKPALKKIGERYLPHDLLYRRKNGLLLPYDEWLADPKGLGRYLDDLTAPDCELASFTEPARLRKTVSTFRSGDTSVQSVVFKLINIETWLRSLRKRHRDDLH